MFKKISLVMVLMQACFVGATGSTPQELQAVVSDAHNNQDECRVPAYIVNPVDGDVHFPELQGEPLPSLREAAQAGAITVPCYGVFLAVLRYLGC